MANVQVVVFENLTLDENNRNNVYSKTYSGVNYLDHRTLLAPSGSKTRIFSYDGAVDRGTFITGSIVYGRISNLNDTYSVNLEISSSTENFHQKISPGGSFMLTANEMTGSYTNNDINYDNIRDISVQPISGAAKIEYYITTS